MSWLRPPEHGDLRNPWEAKTRGLVCLRAHSLSYHTLFIAVAERNIFLSPIFLSKNRN